MGMHTSEGAWWRGEEDVYREVAGRMDGPPEWCNLNQCHPGDVLSCQSRQKVVHLEPVPCMDPCSPSKTHVAKTTIDKEFVFKLLQIGILFVNVP